MAVVREYKGERFYLKKGGHYRNPNSSLHRRVWEEYNGIIPDGMIIHHIDNDPSNNEIENLALLTRNEHTSFHMREPENVLRMRATLDRVRSIGNIIDVAFKCEACGKDALGPRKSFHLGKLRKRFCSKKCASRVNYLRNKAVKGLYL